MVSILIIIVAFYDIIYKSMPIYRKWNRNSGSFLGSIAFVFVLHIVVVLFFRVFRMENY